MSAATGSASGASVDSATAAVRAASDRKRLRQIQTPEGVLLPVTIGLRGDRVVAFAIDLAILAGVYLGIWLVFVLFVIGWSGAGAGWMAAVVLVTSFLWRSFYFSFFELRWQGRTPGKRAMGLRVIDRHGGPLKPNAVLARNIMREVEFWLPFFLLMSGQFKGLTAVLTLGWLAIFMLMPVFNRDAMRVGDMIAGTWVIAAPKTTLAQDLALRASRAETPAPAAPGKGAALPVSEPAVPDAAEAARRHGFTDEQLDAYGIYELQTLENVLRDKGPNAAATRAEVAKRIVRKIAWRAEQGPDGQPFDANLFLADFYAGLRGRLERRMLFGHRRRDKHDS